MKNELVAEDRPEACRDKVDRINEMLDKTQALLDELVGPVGKESEKVDTDSIIASLEYKLSLLEDKASYILEQLRRLSMRL